MGWANHESQWRGAYFDKVALRQEDIQTIYQTRDWNRASALLAKYRVEYVVVSSWERNWYKPVFTAKFDQHLQKVFSRGEVTLYRNYP
jgi:uncharacterized membrane protein